MDACFMMRLVRVQAQGREDGDAPNSIIIEKGGSERMKGSDMGSESVDRERK